MILRGGAPTRYVRADAGGTAGDAGPFLVFHLRADAAFMSPHPGEGKPI